MSHPPTGTSAGQGEVSAAMRAAASEVRPRLGTGRSDRLPALFDFLLERTLAGAPPNEQQIADEVFSNGRTGLDRRDANVRVYIHRLRRLLNDMPAMADGTRLDLPVGSYMLRLVEPSGENVLDATPDVLASPAPRPFGRSSAGFVLALVAAILLAIGGWFAFRPATGAGLAKAMPWAALVGSDRPITLVMGDYYLFTSISGQGAGAARPIQVWDRTVPTREDLIIYQMLNPDKAAQVADHNQQYVTSGTIAATFAIRNALRRDAAFRKRSIRLVSASQLSPELLKSTDVVYVGQMSGLGAILRDPFVQASPFRLDDSLVGMTDMASGKQYHSDGVELRDEKMPRRDYGYIARIPGPAGNSLLVIASLRDPGLREMADLVVDTVRLGTLRDTVARAPQGFEALYQVRTLGSANLGATPVLQRPVRTQGIWDRSASTPEYRPIATSTAGQR
ncbi:helix-turn-helix domain-containing protein [Novosphingobium cyanobacteriorum]|uniref:Helix-turn-helix domain-containing protein n=1 Tax=Novosphingobium cyanobacteriorum TaxID=3024215 RepID=A0ABT6CIL2_9SPHN|nr:helix-turn-helix domain-containing protein [Novosphingobium cyanobacteriorum]MDF8333760.1 helix-turn-helix domain-containing protein [Novosphingobium cyanobacteriorum]